uniref:Wsv111 n=1 Tax=White spot syndrome virus TaxID=92652 RepID=A0A2U9GEL4_WSSV|nr:wsv111 [Shrimp white spot syndrome virus]AWQ63234.1 wsv111 [Shrimp white spot syndrome virus]
MKIPPRGHAVIATLDSQKDPTMAVITGSTRGIQLSTLIDMAQEEGVEEYISIWQPPKIGYKRGCGSG